MMPYTIFRPDLTTAASSDPTQLYILALGLAGSIGLVTYLILYFPAFRRYLNRRRRRELAAAA